MINLKYAAVLGAGTMGAGIAQWFAQAGLEVELADASLKASEKALEKIHASWDKLLAKGKFSEEQVQGFKKRLRVVQTITEYSEKTELLVEAIIEDLQIKKDVFHNLDLHFPKETILASNTSSIPINIMAKNLSDERKKRFIGLHFFNPATIMKLVEIISSEYSESHIIEGLHSFFTEKGKKPAICKDGPGFIVNRVARNFYGESLRIVEEYDQQKIIDTDSILREVGGFKMGPFELMDMIGIDVNYAVTQSVWKAFNRNDRFAPHDLQKQMVESGKLGKKTKGGFYD